MSELERKLQLTYKVTKRRLEEDAPDWLWSGERHGFGWRYVGRRGKEVVRVQRSFIFSTHDDEYVDPVRWMVVTGTTSVDYVSWILRNGVRR